MATLLAGTDKGTTGPVGRMDPSLPQVFGRYLLVQRLSRGGMGEIFLAKHGLAGFEKLAVIKKVLPHLAADQQFISRFVDEAQVAIKLQHVNVAQVFEVGRVGNEYFLALEYVEGRDLRRTLAVLAQKHQRLPVDLALFIGRELANGLAYAHRRTSSDGASLNLVHCDISPPNVLVSFEGETKVIDFGIAKSALRGTATDPKMGFGKFGYMAPEQLIRGGIVDHRTDIYAAGVVLFELLCGRRLYEPGPEPDYRSLAKQVAKGEHKLPSDVDKALAPYDDLVATALRPKAEDRYQSAAEFRDAIQQALVAVNPTISTDQLGAFMRDLFNDEMTAQRELHERVAKTHLEDFQDQLTKETGTTVSFARALLPLKAPELPARKTPTPAPPPERPRPPTAPTDILAIQPPQPPPVPTRGRSKNVDASIDMATTELSLADGTGTMVPTDLSLPQPQLRRSRAPLVIGLAAVGVVIGAVVFAMTRGDDAPKQPAVVASNQVKAPPPQKILVEPIPPDPAPTPPQPEIAPPPAPPPPAKIPHAPPHRRVERRLERAAPPPPKPPELTKELVGQKLRTATHEYEAYKAKNGPRFDQEWNDLASFSTYHGAELEELSRRIDAFRAKLRE
ncbi:MAG: serine/threonine-protein kinase [Acidobacteriota bacterium]